MTATQFRFSRDELLASHDYTEPLVIDGARFHGGFTDEGDHVSPRTRHRWPAIRAWQARLAADTGLDLIDCPEALLADFYPNVEQTRYLLAEGVRDPVVQILTQIGTAEGFQATIRHVEVPDLERHFVEGIDGTATSHLMSGLYEAHTRDEAGSGEEGGHQQMWYAVRDIAFGGPEVADPLLAMMNPGRAGRRCGQALHRVAIARGAGERVVPSIDPRLETMITRMAGLLLIELLSFSAFAWAEEVLSDTNLFERGEEAARLVGYIRADEEPHVAYLRTTLTELRARTFFAVDGRPVAGTEVIDACWEHSIRQMFQVGGTRSARRQMVMGLLDDALDGRAHRKEIMAGFHDLESPDPVVHDAADGRAAGPTC